MNFGTSGLRGLVTDMTDDVCSAYATAFLAHLKAEGDTVDAVLVGRDLRPSSPRMASACRQAICAAGVTAVDCGVLPTPALALEAGSRGLPAIMVTGSHIPFDRNGLKFYRAAGEITKSDEAGIVAALDQPRPHDTAADGTQIKDDGARQRYLDRNRQFFGPGTLAGWRIGVWQHSAAGRDLVVDILGALDAEIVTLGRTDTFVPIDTEAVSAADAAQARTWTEGENLDALVSTDGDGDRPLVADAQGRILRGDLLGLLTARFLGADAVATPISSNTALERSGWIPHVARTRIGSPYVIEAMEALKDAGSQLVVGYEANGGFLLGGEAFGPHGNLAALPTRDALLPMLAVLCAAASRRITLAELAAEAPARFTASDRLKSVNASQSGPFLAKLAANADTQLALLAPIGGASVRSIETLDGVRLTLDNGEIAHLRASGNAPELRVYTEAAAEDRAAAMVVALLARISTLIGS
jgi:phosphomannomutase